MHCLHFPSNLSYHFGNFSNSNKIINYIFLSFLIVTSSSFAAEGNVGQGKRKNEVNAEVHKSLKKIKTRVAIDGSNNELSTVPRESSKVDSWHEALIHSVKPFVKSKSSTDVQNPLEKNQPGTCILSQEIKGNGAAMGMHKYKQREKRKMKQNACNRGMCL